MHFISSKCQKFLLSGLFLFPIAFQSATASVAANNQSVTVPTNLAATKPANISPNSLPEDLVIFFAGSWSGKGEFASGKKIEADVSFSADLNNQWLLYRHTDRLPNQYKSLGMWGIERNSKKLVMTINDSFAGARLFVSEGWQNGRIEFSDSTPISPLAVNNSRRERFIFEKLATDSFKMTYESSTNGAEWKLGDYLIFTKSP